MAQSLDLRLYVVRWSGMMSRVQISMELELRRRASAKAGALGISFAEYVRRLIAEDLGQPITMTDPSIIFDLSRVPKSGLPGFGIKLCENKGL